MKQRIFAALAFSLCVAWTVAAGEPVLNKSGKQAFVGISMPTKSDESWITHGETIQRDLEAMGYRTDLQFANDVVEAQIAQVENMMMLGADVLVIAAIDGESLTSLLEDAMEKKVPVIAYDRMIQNTPHVAYYITFDNFKVGEHQGEYIVKKLGLDQGRGPFNIELFGGSPDDTNSHYFFNGAMSKLRPYIDSGKLAVRSGQTAFEKIATLRWDGVLAQARMDNLLASFYARDRVDAVLSPYDGISIGILSALQSDGYGTPAKPYPVVTGQDAEIASVKSILAGEQTHTVYKDFRKLGSACAVMVDCIVRGKEVPVNDRETYFNGAKILDTYFLDVDSVDIGNVKEILFTGDDSYYKWEDFQ